MADQDFEINQGGPLSSNLLSHPVTIVIDNSALVVHRSESHLSDGSPYLRLVFSRSGEPLVRYHLLCLGVWVLARPLLFGCLVWWEVLGIR
jgi:hypothetical protein